MPFSPTLTSTSIVPLFPPTTIHKQEFCNKTNLTTQPSSSFFYNASKTRLPEHALHLFYEMLSRSTALPDCFTFNRALKACARLSALQEGKQIHSMVIKIHGDVFLQNSLIRMYVKCGSFGDARKLFDVMPERNILAWNSTIDGHVKAGDVDSARLLFEEMPERNLVSWNSVIAGYVRSSLPHEALELFLELQLSGLEPDESTMSSVVSAISVLGLLAAGKMAHACIMRRELSLNGALGVALKSMYSKCGSIGAAYSVFASIQSKNVGHWTAMIVGFAAHGLTEPSLCLFSEMLRSNTPPNYVTFIAVLNACSHGGLVREGMMYFNLMRRFSIEPRIQHYGCLVDLFGRAGLLEEALELINKLPMEPGHVIWSALLAACRKHGNVEIAEIAAKELIEMETTNGSCYVLLSDVYARRGRREDAARVRRKMMEDKGVEKVHGFSWIEVDGCVHEFVAEDMYHERSREIYEMVDEMEGNLKAASYGECIEELDDLRFV